MTREEAIKILEQRFDSSCRNNLFQNVEKLDYEDALWMAISALRSVSREQELETENKELKERIVNWRKYMAPTREQVEKVFPGCEKCRNQANWPSWIEKGFVYCPKCGTPLTSWAWEKQVERLEALKDGDLE